MSQLDRHLTTEQISDYLDQHILSEAQIEAYHAHFMTCAQCQGELDELRQTVTVLRALPQPTLPRSFTLPIAEPVQTSQIASKVLPITAKRQLPERVRISLRSVSTLAAAVGIVFMLSGLLPFKFSSPSPLSSTSQKPMMASDNSTNSGGLITPTTKNASDYQTPTPQVEMTAATPTAAAANSQPTPEPQLKKQSPATPLTRDAQPFYLPVLLFFDLNNASGRISMGIFLFLLGSMGFTFFKHPQRSAIRV